MNLPNRRRFLQTAAAAVLGATLPINCCAPKAARTPNVIFILADDLGYGDLGCYGQKAIKTPNLDKMAAEGMRFTQFYAGSTVCAPSRCSLMTGLHTGHARIRGNALVPFAPEDVAIAEQFKRARYATALIGKWGLGEEGTTGLPRKQGFDYFYGYLNQVHAHSYYPSFLWRNEDKVPLRNKVIFAEEGYAKGVGSAATERVDYSANLFSQEAIQFVERSAAAPFFLYLALTVPHANNEFALAEKHGMEVPDYGIYQDLDWPEPQKGHAAMITRMDEQIGALFDTLKRLGLDEETIVFFSSDNGPHQEGGFSPEFNHSSGPLRGIKRDLYEGGIRVPMIARWPGQVAAGTMSDLPFAFWDILPTCADLAEVSTPGGIDGISILPLLTGHESMQKQHDFLYWEFHEGPSSKQAVRMGDWKCVRLDPKGKLELYNLRADESESHDVADQHPEIVQKMEALLRSARTENAEWPLKSTL
jgi:arylsulfatase A-like enzyme